MFDNPRYITWGVEKTVQNWLQNLIWYTIDTMDCEKKDCLQVFKLSTEDGKQKIVHSQEQPPYEHEYLLKADELVTAKIFVIDDETHSTMLLAEEY